MTLDQLAQTISGLGLVPIPVEGQVEGQIDSDDFPLPLFSGTIEEYLTISRSIETKAFLIYSRIFSQDDLIYEPDDEEMLDEEDERTEEEQLEPVKIDLTVALPELVSYKNKLGSYCSFLLVAVGGIVHLGLQIQETWWQRFSEDRERAIAKVEENRELILKKMEQKRSERDKELIKSLRSFISDDEFVRIATQRGMRSYALEHNPELEQLGDSILTKEVQALWDKIRAKGLHRK
jgi:hypothetical protein